MSPKLLDRLLFMQGQCCFFCNEPLAREVASVEHLLAKSREGTNEVDNCVACCQSLNALFDDMTLKEKMDVVLRQRGTFRCPRTLSSLPAGTELETPRPPRQMVAAPAPADELLDAAIIYLKKYGPRRPRSLAELLDIVTARFAKELGGAHPQSLIDHLCAMGIVAVEHDGVVSYPALPKTA